jgi:hypothetical protein
LEAQAAGVFGGPEDAEVEGEAGEVDVGEAALAQVSGKAGGGGPVVLEEGGVGIDLRVEALRMMSSTWAAARRGWKSAPGVPWTQWSGQRTWGP